MKAMILAGGLGTRLRPLTFSIPKPLLPVGERPILQIIIEQLRSAGVDEIILATGYQAELIRAFCGDGSKFGLRVSYVYEAKPLGTAGPLALARDRFRGDEPFLLMNGDIITKLAFAEFIEAARRTGCDLTVAYTRYTYRSPFGVLTIADGLVEAITEKPSQEYAISAGIYCLTPRAVDLVPDDTFFTMPDLMHALMNGGRKVAAHYVRDCWIGIESIEHFDEALRELARVPADVLPAGGR